MSAASANSTMVSSGKDNSNSANVASSVTSVSPSGLVPSNRSVYGVWDFFNIQVPTVSFTSVSYMLIAVTILMLALAIVHKHVAKPGWKPSSQQLSEKFRLYMAGSMVGDATRRMFNGWTRSRQDSVTISTRDEKNRRDISSSSSISLSPSELPMHDASPRVYKKASKRPNSRLKTPVPSSIDDNPSAASSNDDQTIDQSTEIDESKTTVTINVSDPRSEQSILVTHQEINYEIEGIPENHNGQKAAQEQINSRNGSCQNDSEINNPITFDVLSIPTTNDLLVQVHKKNSKPRLRVQRPQKDQTVVTTQESEGEIESPSTPTAPKISTQDENFVKPVHRRRRRKTKNSKNNTQQNSQENNNSEQRSAKPDTSSKHDHVQQNVNGLPRQRQSDEMSYTNWDKSSHDQHIHLQQPRQIVNNIWQKPLHTEPAQYQTQAHHAQQRSDQSAYYMQGNKRNDAVFQTSNSSTVIPAK
ncbi:9762_t:CDS:2, partial [Scutellospora calospora]